MTEGRPWTWPNREESDRVPSFLDNPDTVVTEHQHPSMFHMRRPDGSSLWVAHLDLIARADFRRSWSDLTPPLSGHVAAESRDELLSRIEAVTWEARIRGLDVQLLPSLYGTPYDAADDKELARATREQRALSPRVHSITRKDS